MTDQLRETLYFGGDDIRRYLTDEQYDSLVALHDTITQGRLADGKMAVYGLFVPETHRSFQAVANIYNHASTGDQPLVVMPTDEWYPAVASLTAAPSSEVYQAENDIQQPSVGRLTHIRSKYSPVMSALAKALRKDTVDVGTVIALEADQFVALASAAAKTGDPQIANQGQRAWEDHDDGFDQTMSALQCARERLLEAEFHLNRITNTNYIHPSRTGLTRVK